MRWFLLGMSIANIAGEMFYSLLTIILVWLKFKLPETPSPKNE